MATTQIHVTKCDNELILLASQPQGSSELIHVKAGYNAPVDATIVPQYILNGGQYTLTMIGINWGNPAAFEVRVTTDGKETLYPNKPVPSDVGVVWTQSIPMTV
ncbi:MAG: hypothetical protein V4460_09185 [Pseudomonadota bacterium]